MAGSIRPRTLAAVFGVFFLAIAYFAWTFAHAQPTAWYGSDITRWIYTTYMLVSAIFLVGLGGMGVSIRRSFTKQIRQLEARLTRGSSGPMPDALPPPLPETTTPKDHVDRDIDELLESLSEVEATARQESRTIEGEPEGVPGVPIVEATDREIAARKTRLSQRQKLLGGFVAGPGLVAAVVLGLSGIMLLGSDGFDQANFALNTAVILGIGYSWLGIGAYIAATVAALVSSKGGRKG
jgi:hypothetical protein